MRDIIMKAMVLVGAMVRHHNVAGISDSPAMTFVAEG